VGVAIGGILGDWPASLTRRKNDGSRTDFNRSSGCPAAKGTFTQWRKEFLREVEALKREHLSRREPRELARPWQTDTPVRPITSFHADRRYGGDLHRADMAWAVHAAIRGLSREQIEHEILNSRDLSKKGSAIASVGLRYADGEQGDRSVHAIKSAFAMENSR
jgi:hypothetical protein